MGSPRYCYSGDSLLFICASHSELVEMFTGAKHNSLKRYLDSGKAYKGVLQITSSAKSTTDIAMMTKAQFATFINVNINSLEKKKSKGSPKV